MEQKQGAIEKEKKGISQIEEMQRMEIFELREESMACMSHKPQN